MQFFRDTHIGFVNLRHKAYILSGALILIGIISLIARGGPNLSIDFEGGTLIQVKFDEHVPADKLREAVTTAGFNNAKIQDFGESNEYLITVEKISETAKSAEILMGALAKDRARRRMESRIDKGDAARSFQELRGREPHCRGSLENAFA